MGSLVDAFLPKDLQGGSPIQQYLKIQLEQLELLRSIEENTSGSTEDRPEPDAFFVDLPFQTSQKLRVVGILISTDTIGLYALTVGQTTLLRMRLGINSPQLLGLDGLKSLHIARGLDIGVSAPAGAVWYATLIAVPE